MAYCINQVMLIGNVGGEPKVRDVNYNDHGQPSTLKVSQFSLATSKGGGKDKAGNDLPTYTQWHNIVAWRRLAEIPLKKGDKVCVIGELQYRDYEVDGQKRSITEIVASEIFPIAVERKATMGTPSGYQVNTPPLPNNLPF